ncbi:lysylphosphatidylglycerol synthase transmembrane domain-containing protein [Larkinella insperata]|uniref:Lysylphosphatidylglycerol synthase transmembrane domain-containing protein n=1 Tax=Larkinella insperata TaxID=332158 RepID=A0ABW3Q201_9BACT|nr:lysylphosphatidylglycerol synthase transmembrane domain-containing protein [Larkinella insperata]
MQSNGFVPQRTYSRTKKIAFWSKIGILLLIVSYIFLTVNRQQHDFQSAWRYWQNANWLSFSAFLLLLLTPVNWLLEALKWQILVRRVEPISLGEATQGVLAGLAMGFALPAQLGDTAGRLLSLRSDQRWEGIGAALVSGGMQFFAALFFGTVALFVRLQTGATELPMAQWILFWLLLLTLALGLLAGWFRHRLAHLPFRWMQRWEKYWAVAAHYTTPELWLAFGVAALRYLTFSLQFYLAMNLFGIDLPIRETTTGIGLVYLGKTIIPAFNLLSDLGVREATSMWVFGQWQVPATQILSATLTLWLINILAPVLVGLFWVWKLKLTNRH